MVDGECRAAAFSPLCVKMSPLIQSATSAATPPPKKKLLPISPASLSPSPPCACCLCLLVRLFLLSCQRQHYHIPVAWETSAQRQRLKTLAVFEAGEHERLSAVQPRVGLPADQNASSFAGTLASVG